MNAKTPTDTRSYIECIPLTDGSSVFNVVVDLPGDGSDNDWQGGSGSSIIFRCVDENHARILLDSMRECVEIS